MRFYLKLLPMLFTVFCSTNSFAEWQNKELTLSNGKVIYYKLVINLEKNVDFEIRCEVGELLIAYDIPKYSEKRVEELNLTKQKIQFGWSVDWKTMRHVSARIQKFSFGKKSFYIAFADVSDKLLDDLSTLKKGKLAILDLTFVKGTEDGVRLFAKNTNFSPALKVFKKNCNKFNK